MKASEEQVLDQNRKASPWLNRNVWMMSIASLFSDMGHEAATSILPVFLASLGASAGALGIIEGIADAGSSFLKYLTGHYSDRVGRRKEIMLAGYSLTAVAKACFAFATSWTSIVWLRLIAWLGRGSRGPVRDAVMADSVMPQNYGRAFGFQRAMDTLGAVAGPAIALLLVSHVALRKIFLLTFIPGVLAVIAIYAVRDPKPTPSLSYASQEPARLSGQFKSFLAAVGIFGLGNFSHTLLILRASELLKHDYGAARANALAIGLYTLHNLVYAATSFPAGHWGDRRGRGSMLLFGYVLFSLMSLGFGFVHSLGELVVLFLAAGIYVGFVDTLETSYAAQLLPQEIRGRGFGVLGLVNGVGDLASSAVVGLLWSRISAPFAFSYAAVLSMTGAVVLVLSLPRRAHVQ